MAATLKIQDVADAFAKTVETVNNWRVGSTRREPLPVEKIQQGQRALVRFDPKIVRAWAKKHNVPIIDESKLASSKRSVAPRNAEHA